MEQRLPAGDVARRGNHDAGPLGRRRTGVAASAGCPPWLALTAPQLVNGCGRAPAGMDVLPGRAGYRGRGPRGALADQGDPVRGERRQGAGRAWRDRRHRRDRAPDLGDPDSGQVLHVRGRHRRRSPHRSARPVPRAQASRLRRGTARAGRRGHRHGELAVAAAHRCRSCAWRSASGSASRKRRWPARSEPSTWHTRAVRPG